jgi:hypothetical protein
MAESKSIDGVLIQWGDRLFYPGNRIVKTSPQPRLLNELARRRAASIRAHIEATVVRRAPQVLVKVTGGGRGMKAIAAHFKYISKNGRLEIEDDRGETFWGKEALRDIADDWRLGGTMIDDVGYRREAFNIMLSMPRGTDPMTVLKAAREFAQVELADHKYVMVLHDHQANPHVHLSVRAESRHGKRLNPRRVDLSRWRETFAERLREWGVDAEASRGTTRGSSRNYEPLWRIKAREDGRLRTNRKMVDRPSSPVSAVEAWQAIARALGTSAERADCELGRSVAAFVAELTRARAGPELKKTEIQSLETKVDVSRGAR